MRPDGYSGWTPRSSSAVVVLHIDRHFPVVMRQQMPCVEALAYFELLEPSSALKTQYTFAATLWWTMVRLSSLTISMPNSCGR